MTANTTRRNPRSMTSDELAAERAAMGGSNAIAHDAGAGDGSCYVTWHDGRYFVGIGYRGKALRSAWALRFSTEQQRSDYVESWVRQLKLDAEIAAQRKRKHTLEVGNVLHASFGYEMTTCHFYEVVAVRGASVDLRQIMSEQVSGDTWSGHLMPRPGKYHAGKTVIRKRPDGENCVKLESYKIARPWDGQRKHFSTYG